MLKKMMVAVSALLLVMNGFGRQAWFKDSVAIPAKVWSRDSERKIRYAEWRNFTAHSIDMLRDYNPGNVSSTDRYGGDLGTTVQATGFFRTEKIKNRWMVIDPEGHPFIVSAVNSFRQGKSPNNEKAFQGKFGTVQNWMAESVATFKSLGFNTAGSWSETEPLVQYNKTSAAPFAYTTQLNLLLGYAKYARTKQPDREKQSILSFILDEDFPAYCNREAKKLAAAKNDSNLLGHFSDNELPFLHTAFKDILEVGDKTNPCYLAALNWMQEKKVDAQTISKDQKEEFMGWLGGLYFKTVSTAIKTHDPNHLYIGSRLHSSAKNNMYIFKAAEPFIDIISINYYGYWQPQENHIAEWKNWSNKPFFITEFYTKAEDAGMTNMSGAGWLVKTQTDRGLHYQNFCLELLRSDNCVGWHWFRYQDNDPEDPTADPSNNDSNKGLVNTTYEVYESLAEKMKALNTQKYLLIQHFKNANQ